MKRFLVGLVAAALLVLGAVAPAAAAGAGNTVVNSPVNDLVILPNGDPLIITGTLHNVFHTFTTPAGTMHYLCHFNFEDAHGVDLKTGTQYELVGARTHTANFVLFNGQEEYTISYQYQLVEQGHGPTSSSATWIMKMVEHLTVSANGSVSVFFTK